ncbi:EamA family transporter [Modestobacter sp. NPDC049651]|uniref:EamA family transporter n=1 Tax=unclassified Modestobacter TaxID=2643866 RepID=UPI00340E03FF
MHAAPAVSSPRTGPAVLMVLGSCTSLQVGAAFAAQLFPRVGPAGASLLRLGLAALVLLALARPRLGSWTRRQWTAVLAFGGSLVGMNGAFYAAIDRIPLGTAVTVEFLGPLVLAAVQSRRLRDLSWVALAAAGVAVLGLTDGGAGGGLDPVGVVFALVAGVFWALYILASARVGAAVPGQGGLAVAMGVAALLLVPLGATGAAHLSAAPHLVVVAVTMAVLASVVPYSLELAALRRLPTRVFGVLLSLEPAVATLAGWLMLGQGIGPVGLVAIGLVVLASVGSTLSARPAPTARQVEPEPLPA